MKLQGAKSVRILGSDCISTDTAAYCKFWMQAVGILIGGASPVLWAKKIHNGFVLPQRVSKG
jgi:hypothetical protein